jgi:hypothetical protein
VSDPAGTLILQLHYHGPADRTPTHMVSEARLAYYEQAVQELFELRAQLATLDGHRNCPEFDGISAGS